MEILPIIGKMAVLVLLMLVGYACAAIGLTSPEFNKKVTPVVLNVLLVATILNSVISAEELVSGMVLLEYLGAFVAMFVVSMVVAWLCARLLRRDRDDEGVLRMVMMFMNNAFVGFPVVAALFGPQAVFYAAISNIPFNVLLYTVGTAPLPLVSDAAGAREMTGVEDLILIAERMLRLGYSEKLVEKIFYDNAKAFIDRNGIKEISK